MGMDLGGAPSAQFDPGDELDGTIVRVETMQGKNMTTGEAEFWDAAKTQPKMIIVATMTAPGHKDADDGGEVTLYVSGGKYTAVKAVTKRLDEGARLWIKCVGTRPAQTKGHNPSKRYEAKYWPAKT